MEAVLTLKISIVNRKKNVSSIDFDDEGVGAIQSKLLFFFLFKEPVKIQLSCFHSHIAPFDLLTGTICPSSL